jgi:lipopolysaccharide export system permease protein
MKLYLHILKTHAAPFLFAFFTLMFVFLLQFLMRAINQLVGKGLSGWVITELIILSLSYMVVLAVPMAVLVATLMAFGKLASQNEITAMKASGMSLYKMMAPVVLASVVLTFLLIQFNNKVLPEANHRFKVLMIDIRRTKPTFTIQAGLFSQEIPGYSILARKTFEQSNDLEGVTLYDYTDPGANVVVTARRGNVSFTPDYQKLIMDLYDGSIHKFDLRESKTYRTMNYERHRIVMDAEGFDFERSSLSAFDRSDRELSAPEMKVIVDSIRRYNEQISRQVIETTTSQPSHIRDPRSLGTPDTASIRKQSLTLAHEKARNTLINITNQVDYITYNNRRINEYLVEIYKKYSIPAACIVFIFLGAPLGIIARRGTFGVAATVSLGFFVIYWAALIAGEKFADRGLLSPWLGMWMANIVLFVIGLYLTFRIGRETPAINWNAFKRFLPHYFRPLDTTEPPQYERT